MSWPTAICIWDKQKCWCQIILYKHREIPHSHARLLLALIFLTIQPRVLDRLPDESSSDHQLVSWIIHSAVSSCPCNYLTPSQQPPADIEVPEHHLQQKASEHYRMSIISLLSHYCTTSCLVERAWVLWYFWLLLLSLLLLCSVILSLAFLLSCY